ncbi:MAG: hypothetical protein AAF909_00425 [Pseudomonadota bacterium]
MAAADIKRGCSGTISALIAGTKTQIAELDASGFCKNKRKADNCRAQARSMIEACAQAMWNDRWDHRISPVCLQKPDAPRRGVNYFRWTQVIEGLPNGQGSLKDRIEYNTCCLGNRGPGNFLVNLSWFARGDRGCSRGGLIYEGYEVNCRQMRQAGLCGAPRRTSGR